MDLDFTPAQIQQLRVSFEAIDTDHNGYLNEEELNVFMKQSHLDTSLIKAIFKVFDSNGDGQLSFQEFYQYLKACLVNTKKPRHLFKMIFDSVDKDHDGSLNLNEVMEFVSLCGKSLSREEAQREIDTLDKDKNKKLEFDEICDTYHM